jgi:type IV secretory pathway VirB4 component
LFPLVAGAGAPAVGVPVGRHLVTGEQVHLDPFAWLESGLTTNTGVFQLGQPGTGKSAFVKRQVRGRVGAGSRVVVLGDPKGEYTPLVERLGGQVIRIGPGLDRINPLDAHALPGADAHQTRSRRVTLLAALCGLVRGGRPMGSGEQVVLAAAVDELAGRPQPDVPALLGLLGEPTPRMVQAAQVPDRAKYDEVVQDLRWTLSLLAHGPLRGVFDGPSSLRLDPSAAAVAVDLSGVHDETMLGAAMLSAWAWGHAAIAADRSGGAPGRWLVVMDELWRALRGAPGLVDHADSLTRLNRSQGVASMMVTHSLDDLRALPGPHDVAKAKGFIDRSAIVVLSGLPRRELREVSDVVALTDAECDLVSGWASGDSWRPDGRHPGRGKYLIKAGRRPGLPVQMELSPQEVSLYDTDPRAQTRTATDRAGECR